MDFTIRHQSPDQHICSICKDDFTDPVILECGHRFCSPCYCLLWENLQVPAHCPVCHASSQKIDFKSAILSMSWVLPTTALADCQLPSSAVQVCGIHLIIKSLICDGNNSLVCLLCSLSPEHITHIHWPIKQAAEYFREKILMQMKYIWKKKQKNHRNLTKETYIISIWKDIMALRMMIIQAEYPKVYQYLHEEKQRHLDNLVEEAKMIFSQLRDNRTRMTWMGKVLKEMYEMLKNFYHEADELLLQGVEEIMKRIEVVMKFMPQPLNPQFSSRTITGMSERMDVFRVNITLDPEDCRQHMLLWRDLRDLQHSCSDPDELYHPASSECTSSWGAQIFLSGKHYWEVNIENSQNWIIGLCKDSWTRRNDMRLESEGLFLFLCVKVGDHFYLFSTSPLVRHYIQTPQHSIGVFLDYECGIVSFINVAQSSLIFSFLSQLFSFHLRPFVFYEPKD